MARSIAILVRHGDYQQVPDTPSAHQPYPLNGEGESQAHETAQLLHDMIVGNEWILESSIDSSRMLRAWQTAMIIADRLAGQGTFPLRIDSFDALAERSVGCLANLTTAEIEAILQQDPRVPDPPADWKADSHYRLPVQGAESLLEAGKRVATHLVESMAALPPAGHDRVKIFVGHGGAFRHAACHLGVLKLAQVRQLSMHHCLPILLEYLPGGDWCHIGGDWKVRTGHTGHTD
ncbi:MAG: histidine phosphatase family protein [Gammaproteobacteria bacterium]|nr:histidine phosphatase family protein [Gammaproteobacteria bacterium]